MGVTGRGRGRLLAALTAFALLLALAGCGAAAPEAAQQSGEGESSVSLLDDFRNPDLGNGWQPRGSMELAYAHGFTVDYYEGGYQLLCLADGSRFLTVPEGASAPEGLASDICVLTVPMSDVYLAASDSMCLFDALDAVDAVTVSGIERDSWSIALAREAMDQGRMVYGGKYRSPDYELLLSKGVRLAVESSMISHAPEVREKLQELGIPVLVEFSSYEDEPLGRAEWVRLYGALLDKDRLAEEVFQRQLDQVSALGDEPTGKTVAFFYLNSAGAAVVRRPGDYVSKMIEQAGGSSVFENLDAAQAGSSSATLQMEAFYAAAKDADVLIYNGSVDSGLNSLDDLLARSELLADFKAVQSGDVWVTEQDMYQQMLETGTIIADMHRALLGQDEGLTYLRRLT